ncbi:MAG: ferric reductase-like transmembrane domain-containing protein [Pseudomonadota bacterium]
MIEPSAEKGSRIRALSVWFVLVAVSLAATFAAALSPLLQWRDLIYQLASFSGILALILLVVQPLLATNILPIPERFNARRVHRFLGLVLLGLVLVHVAALWVTSPPDVVDALLLVSPTPFSLWGVIAMWALIGAAAVVALRRLLTLRFSIWQKMHLGLTAIAVAGTIAHVLLIEGVMEQISKIALCVVAALAFFAGFRSRRKRI